MINLSPKLDILSLLARQVSHLVAGGHSLEEAIRQLRQASDDSLAKDIEQLQVLLMGEMDVASVSPAYRYSPIFTIGRLTRLARSLEGNPLAILLNLKDTLDSLTGGYRAYWVGISAFLSYAGLLFLVALIALLIFSIFVLPQFKELFTDFGADLPALTDALISLTDILRWPAFLIGLGLVVALVYIVSEIKGGMKRLISLQGIVTRVPGLRRLCRSYNESLTLNFASLLHSAGVSAEVALEEAAKLTHTDLQAEKRAASNDNLANSIRRNTIWGSLSLARRCDVLDHELAYLASEAQALHAECLIKLREEFTLIAQVFAGVLVAALVMSMYLPIFKLGSVI